MILICRTVEIDKTLGYDPAAGGTMDPNIFFQWAMGVPAAVRRVRSDRAEAAPAAATQSTKSPAIDGHRRTPPAGVAVDRGGESNPTTSRRPVCP